MDLKSCPDCSQLTAADNDACPYCGYVFELPDGRSQPVALASRRKERKRDSRNPLLAAACAFLFPGWGQWYNGRTAEGIYVIAAGSGIVIVSAMLMFMVRGSETILMAIAAVAGLLLLVLWVYSITTAYNTARGINRGGTAFTGKSLLFWMPATLWVLFFGVIVIVVASLIIPGLPGSDIPATISHVGGSVALRANGFLGV
ncbi:MAG: hypothetical protein CVV32_12245 [Methanomicrobiales archaeon HGW-Methanomicrobiales-3]|jgi:TM2 domain-containing membrane protein YozV|nr:MAG: hypothetical protein CVV32_12245 [Methanomicrobiales archaeon HGW-Methanomicrobiales-3]